MEKDKNIEEAKKSILDNADEYFDLTQTNNNFVLESQIFLYLEKSLIKKT